MAGVVLYAGVDVVLQQLPPHYSPVRDAESNLAVGPFGWVMRLNFLGRAATTLCVVRAVCHTGPASRRRSCGAVLLGIGGACSGVLAFFNTDIATGSTPAAAPGEAGPGADGPGEAGPGANATAAGFAGTALSATTWTGTVHLAVAGTGFMSALAGMAVLTGWLGGVVPLRRTRKAAAVFAGIAAAGLGSTVLAGRHFPAVLGAAERMALAGILGWAFAVSAGLRSLKGRS